MISIIIPTLREEKIIGRVLKALKDGITIPHEVIVSDGGSTDKTAEIARQYADKVIVYSGTARQTIAQGRNDGARAAVGNILVFMDADCFLNQPNAFLERVEKRFREDSHLVALAGWLRVLPEEATFLDKLIQPLISTGYWFMNNVLHIGAASTEFHGIRRTAFDTLGGYNEKMVAAEDIDMFNRLSKIGATRLDTNLIIYHTGRRAHKIGWPHLLSLWFLNTVWLIVWQKPYSKEWKVVR